MFSLSKMKNSVYCGAHHLKIFPEIHQGIINSSWVYSKI